MFFSGLITRRDLNALVREVVALKERNNQAVAQIADLQMKLSGSQSEMMERLNARVERLEQEARVHTASR